MDNKTAVRVENLVKNYDLGKTQVQALRGVSLTIAAGEFLTVAGASGSGKSTLLNIIGCLDHATSGRVWIHDTEVAQLATGQLDRLRSHSIGFIFQAFNLIPVLDVYENVELPLLIRPDVAPAERRERIRHFLAVVGLDDLRRRRPAELSGGQRQRVAVARALATKPQIVLADEPTASLDSKTGIEIIEMMHLISREERTTFVFSTHDPKVMSRADRIVTLQDGQIIGEETQ